MTLDELLLEWSYRSERGYPTLDNPSDVSVLKEILKEFNLSELGIFIGVVSAIYGLRGADIMRKK